MLNSSCQIKAINNTSDYWWILLQRILVVISDICCFIPGGGVLPIMDYTGLLHLKGIYLGVYKGDMPRGIYRVRIS